MPKYLYIIAALFMGCIESVEPAMRQVASDDALTITSIHDPTIVIDAELIDNEAYDVAEVVETGNPEDTTPVEDTAQPDLETISPETVVEDTVAETDMVDPTADRDNDGVPDHEDECPDEVEWYDYYEDEDGCPEEDQDHDGYSRAEGDCDDDSTDMVDPSSFCLDEFGYYLILGDPFVCLEGSEFVFLTDGSFLNGPQIDGQDYPFDGFDNDCDGNTDEAGEYGLECEWYDFGDGTSLVDCDWMQYLLD